MAQIDVLFQLMAQRRASDLHLCVGNKPESAKDMAYFADGSEAVGPDVWDGILNDDPPGPGTTAFPPFSSPRMVAGGDIQGDIFKTYLIPVEEAVAGGTSRIAPFVRPYLICILLSFVTHIFQNLLSVEYNVGSSIVLIVEKIDFYIF